MRKTVKFEGRGKFFTILILTVVLLMAVVTVVMASVYGFKDDSAVIIVVISHLISIVVIVYSAFMVRDIELEEKKRKLEGLEKEPVYPVEFHGEYKSYVARKLLFIFFCVIVCVAVTGISCTIGSRDIGFFEAYEIIFNHIRGVRHPPGSLDWLDWYVIWNVRLPRIAAGLIAGASLAICGTVMQSVLRNPLADPYTTGVSSGVCFGAALALVFGFSVTTVVGKYGLILNAFLFGIIPSMVVAVVSRMPRSTTATVILAGVAMSYLFSSFTTLMLVSTGVEEIHKVYHWQIGSITDLMWSDVRIMLVMTLIGAALVMFTSRKLNLMMLGDESAKSLGLDAATYRMLCLILVSLMAASIMSFTGVIGFVGLVSPHIVRMVIGADNKFTIPGSIALGAAMLLSADLLGRLIVPSGEIPVGIVMSFVGGPLFLYFIIRQKKAYGERVS